MPENNLPYSLISEELNDILADIMTDWKNLVIKAKNHGLDIKFAPDSQSTLELYFNDDYPHTILVNKDISCKSAFPANSESSVEPYSPSRR